jgi:hypothetical protein
MKYLSLFVFTTYCILLCSCKEKQRSVKQVENQLFFIDAKDTLLLGVNSLNDDLFQSNTNTIFKNNIDYQTICKEIDNICEGGGTVDVCGSHHHRFEDIFGVYINEKMLNDLSFKHEKPSAGHINLVYIYPVKKRYNYQCSELKQIYIANYINAWYQEFPPLDLNPGLVDSITRIDKSTINIYSEKGIIKFIQYPKIKIYLGQNETSDNSNTYIKVDESITNFNFSVDSLDYVYPQDFTEIYLRELTTKLYNIKNKTNYKTSDIIKSDYNK